MSENEEKKTVNWVRGPKTADLSDVPLEKLVKAHEERGIEVDLPAGGKGKATIVKNVVTGMPAPREKEEDKK